MNTLAADEKAETEALCASEMRYRRVFETAQDGVLILDAESGQVVDVNPYLVKLLGHTREDLLHKKVWELGFFRDIAANEAKFAELQAEDYVRYENLPLATADGRRIEVEFVSNVYLVNQHRVIQCNIRDITVRKRAEEAVRGSEHLFRKLVDIVPDAIFIQTAGRFAYVNAAAVRLFGASHSKDLLGQLAHDRIRPDCQAEARERLWLLTEAHQEVPAQEKVYLRLDGSPVEVSVTGIPFRYEDQNGALLVVRDISARKQEAAALSASELRYRRLFESAKDGILILDAETGMVVDVNPFLVVLLGLTHTAFLGKKVWELGFFKDIAANAAKFAELQAKDYVRYEDLPLETADGRKIDVEFVSNVYLVNGQRVIQCNIRDITARKRTEEALRAARKITEDILNAIPVRVFWKDKQLAYLGCNLAFARDAGLAAPEDLIGKDDTQMGWREQAEKYRADDYQVIETGVAKLLLEETQTTPTGKTITLLTSKLPLHDTHGAICGVLGIYMDITERKRAIESQARLATAVEQAAETIVITDPQGTILYANPAFEKITGYTRQEAHGQNPRVLKSGKHDAEFYRTMWAALKAGQVWRGHLINKRKDGVFYEEEATISPVLDAAGKIINYVAVKRDVTREVALEAQNRQAEKLGAVGQLAGGVAHDFNNKLQIILGSVEMILQALPPDDLLHADLRDVQEAALQSADLTRQLLAFSRKQAISPVMLDVTATISGSLKMLGRLIGENIRLNFAVSRSDWRVFMDPSQLDQILANLAVNARDAIAGTGTISIAASQCTIETSDGRDKAEAVAPGDYVVLTFRDDGAGMTPEVQAHIFEPFFTTKGVGAGTGLGLATVYGIVQQNNGAIAVHSTPGAGTTFTIYLPRTAAVIPSIVEVKAQPPKGTETILLAEDDENVLTLVQRALAKLGYTILPTLSPQLALEVCAQHPGPIHLLLTDVIMPKMSGKALAESVQKLRPEIQVLYMSGYPADIMEQQGQLPAGLHVLAKPFNSTLLAQSVRAALDTAQPMLSGTEAAG